MELSSIWRLFVGAFCPLLCVPGISFPSQVLWYLLCSDCGFQPWTGSSHGLEQMQYWICRLRCGGRAVRSFNCDPMKSTPRNENHRRKCCKYDERGGSGVRVGRGSLILKGRSSGSTTSNHPAPGRSERMEGGLLAVPFSCTFFPRTCRQPTAAGSSPRCSSSSC